jgi:hypothetical protein
MVFAKGCSSEELDGEMPRRELDAALAEGRWRNESTTLRRTLISRTPSSLVSRSDKSWKHVYIGKGIDAAVSSSNPFSTQGR